MNIFRILIFIGVFCIIIGIVIAIMKDPTKSICDYNPGTGQPFPPNWSRPDCVYLSELNADSTIAPGPQVFMGDFSFSQGAGEPFCINTWYASRWVRQSDGAYGPLSPWTTIPIASGNNVFPCAPNGCSTINKDTDTSNFNAPTLVTLSTLPYSIEDGYYLNLHRHVSNDQPSNRTIGKIVGVLYPDFGNFTSRWTDVVYNPKSC